MERSKIQEKQRVKASNPVLRCTSHELPMITYFTELIIMATTNINIRTDSDIKAQAQAIFASLGLDMTTAVNLFLRQTVRQNDLPFVLTNLPQNKPVQAQPASREQMFGLLRDQYQMSADFDAPLDDFKDYM